MLTLEFENAFNIKTYKGNVPFSLTMINDYFYVCYPDSYYILSFDASFTLTEKIPVCRNYFCIAYNPDNQCYYALDMYELGKIYILDEDFHEIEYITFTCGDIPCSIAYNNNVIYIALSDRIISLCDGVQQVTIFSLQSINCISITISQNCLYVLEAQSSCYCLYTLDLYGYLLDEAKLSYDSCIYDFMLNHEHIYILTQQECNQYEVIKYTILEMSCQEEQGCEYSCNAYINRIANIENSIACILNSEGLKIQHAIAQGASIDEMLCINDSVLNTILQITQLEQLLYTRLRSQTQCCDDTVDELHSLFDAITSSDYQ